MKKLLSLLGAMVIVSSSMMSVVSCQNDNVSHDNLHSREVNEIVDNANTLAQKGTMVIYNTDWNKLDAAAVKSAVISRVILNFSYINNFEVVDSPNGFQPIAKGSNDYVDGSYAFNIRDKQSGDVLKDNKNAVMTWTVKFNTSSINDVKDVYNILNNPPDNSLSVDISNYNTDDFLAILKAFGYVVKPDSNLMRLISLFSNGLGNAFRKLMDITVGIPRIMPKLDTSNVIAKVSGVGECFNLLENDDWKRYEYNVVNVLKATLANGRDQMVINLKDISTSFAGTTFEVKNAKVTVNINELAEAIAPDIIHFFNFVNNNWKDGCNFLMLFIQYSFDTIKDYPIDDKGSTDGFSKLNYNLTSTSRKLYTYNIQNFFGDMFGRLLTGTGSDPIPPFEKANGPFAWNTIIDDEAQPIGGLYIDKPPVEFYADSITFGPNSINKIFSWYDDFYSKFIVTMGNIIRSVVDPSKVGFNPILSFLSHFYKWNDIQNDYNFSYKFQVKFLVDPVSFDIPVTLTRKNNQKVWDNLMHSWLRSYHFDPSIAKNLSFDFVRGNEELEYKNADGVWSTISEKDQADYALMDNSKCKDIRMHFSNLQIKISSKDTTYGDVEYTTDPQKNENLYLNLNIMA